MTENSQEIYMATADVTEVAAVLAEVNAIAQETTATIVLFDAEKIAGRDHITAAVRHAMRSWESGKPIARTRAMEILLYASGQRQCALAPRLGLHAGKNHLYVLILEGDIPAAKKRLAAVVSPSKEEEATTVPVLMQEFGITAEEIEVAGVDRIQELVIERVALMDAYR